MQGQVATRNHRAAEPTPHRAYQDHARYDAFGNVWQYAASGVPSLRQTGSSWYLIGGSTVNNRLANTTYDAMGNQTQLSVSAGTVASYDGENRLSKIMTGSTETAVYTYDAEGRRVAKKVGATTTYYFFDAAGQLMAEYGGPAQTAATHYFTTDYLGSTRMILNATGGCVERLDYAPFGGQISRGGYDCYGGASSEKPLFTGQMRDGESTAGTDTGQDYFNARYFWANTARFTSPDAPFADQRPEDGQSWNMYAYVRNNPLRYVDPSGNCTVDAETGNSVDEQGNACFEVDAPSDRPLPTEVSKAFASVARNAGPVVEAAAVGTVVVPSLAFASAAVISAMTPTATATVGTVGAASQTPSGQQALSNVSTFATNAIRWGPASGRGPLPGAVVATFRSGSYTESVTQEATVLYRAYGGNAGQLGTYWSRIAPSGPLQARIDSALLPQWGNTAENVARIVVPRGTTIYEGFAAGQGSLMGGGSQVFLPRVNPLWLAK
jgi:RHS repeat-associated protein